MVADLDGSGVKFLIPYHMVSHHDWLDPERILVAGRTDVGGMKISDEAVRRFCDDNGFAGYLATSAKGAAQTVLVSENRDPILATWQYGLGKATAFTSDATGRWARDSPGVYGPSRTPAFRSREQVVIRPSWRFRQVLRP